MKNIALLGVLVCACAQAQTPPQEDVPAEIRLQREALGQDRERITQQHDLLAHACWQKFTVNDCLATVRRSKRALLDPIHQKELVLNAQERAWRTRQREERLQDKVSPSGERREQ